MRNPEESIDYEILRLSIASNRSSSSSISSRSTICIWLVSSDLRFIGRKREEIQSVYTETREKKRNRNEERRKKEEGLIAYLRAESIFRCGDLKLETRVWESGIWDYGWICLGFYMAGVGTESPLWTTFSFENYLKSAFWLTGTVLLTWTVQIMPRRSNKQLLSTVRLQLVEKYLPYHLKISTTYMRFDIFYTNPF